MESWKNELYSNLNAYSLTLSHHGIKGQKWGVRNGPPYPLSRQSRFGGNGKNKKGTTNNTAGSIIKKKPKAKMSNELRNERREALSRVYDMSDEELERRVNRLKKEEDLKRLTQQSTETKLDKAKNYIFKLRDRAINRVADKAVDATINEGKKNVDRLFRSKGEAGGFKDRNQRLKERMHEDKVDFIKGAERRIKENTETLKELNSRWDIKNQADVSKAKKYADKELTNWYSIFSQDEGITEKEARDKYKDLAISIATYNEVSNGSYDDYLKWMINEHNLSVNNAALKTEIKKQIDDDTASINRVNSLSDRRLERLYKRGETVYSLENSRRR